MADDWQVGDLALCVCGGRLPINDAAIDYPRTGAVYTVNHVAFAPFKSGENLALWFDDAPENLHGVRVWGAGRFIKVTPPAADEFDLETIELLNRAPENATVSERIDL